MKFFAVIDTNEQVIDNSNNPVAFAGYIEMQSERPSYQHIAQADGSWLYPLELAKAEKWQEIKELRVQKEQAGLPYMGKVLDVDALSVQRITTAVQAAQVAISLGQDFKLNWKTQDNSFLAMNAQEVCGIPLALAKYNDELHNKANELKAKIDQATTALEVENVTWQ